MKRPERPRRIEPGAEPREIGQERVSPAGAKDGFSVALTGLGRFLLVEDPAHARMGWAIFSRPVGAGGGTGGFDIFSPGWGRRRNGRFRYLFARMGWGDIREVGCKLEALVGRRVPTPPHFTFAVF